MTLTLCKMRFWSWTRQEGCPRWGEIKQVYPFFLKLRAKLLKNGKDFRLLEEPLFRLARMNEGTEDD